MLLKFDRPDSRVLPKLVAPYRPSLFHLASQLCLAQLNVGALKGHHNVKVLLR